MEKLPGVAPRIAAFLEEHHVVALAVVHDGQPWAASCFYAFDAPAMALIVLTSEQTRHGAAMLANPLIAATVAGQPERLREIRGVQLRARAQRLGGEAERTAHALYCRRHPVARLKRSAVWRLTIEELKFTDNALSIGNNKTCWQRCPGSTHPLQEGG